MTNILSLYFSFRRMLQNIVLIDRRRVRTKQFSQRYILN